METFEQSLHRAKLPWATTLAKRRAGTLAANPKRYHVCAFPSYLGSPIGTDSFLWAMVIAQLRATFGSRLVEIFDTEAPEELKALNLAARQIMAKFSARMPAIADTVMLEDPNYWEIVADWAEEVTPPEANEAMVDELRRLSAAARACRLRYDVSGVPLPAIVVLFAALLALRMVFSVDV